MRQLLTILFLLPALATIAQGGKKIETIEIRTSAVCDMCVTTIQENIIYEKGVKKVKVHLAGNLIHVDYDPKKTDPDAIRRAVAKLGYWADGLPGDPKAFSQLPDCCQKEGCGQPVEKH